MEANLTTLIAKAMVDFLALCLLPRTLEEALRAPWETLVPVDLVSFSSLKVLLFILKALVPPLAHSKIGAQSSPLSLMSIRRCRQFASRDLATFVF